MAKRRPDASPAPRSITVSIADYRGKMWTRTCVIGPGFDAARARHGRPLPWLHRDLVKQASALAHEILCMIEHDQEV